MTNDFGRRYDIKQAYGINNQRTDGSTSTRNAHEEGGAAEALVARLLRLTPNLAITISGDGHVDLTLDGKTIDVKWTSWKGRGKYLKVNPHETIADLYVLVASTQAGGQYIVGYATREMIQASGLRDFGYGPKLAVHEKDLLPFSELQALL